MKEYLTFRLSQSIKFNRPIDKNKDYISPGGYAFKTKNQDGEEVLIEFDFDESEGGVSDQDPTIADFTQKNPSYSAFPCLETLTEDMLRNITKCEDYFIYTGEDDEDDRLIPVAIINPEFEVVRMDGSYAIIPIDLSISPSC